MNVGLYENYADDDWEIDDEEDMLLRRRPRIFRPRINFDRDEIDSRERFRLTTAHVRMLDERIGDMIRHETDLNCALSSEEQIKISLRYLSTGDYYRTVADSHGISRSTLSRSLHRFVSAINRVIFPEVVDWPNDPNLLNGIANEFYTERGMPSCFGCVDGSYFKIKGPSGENEPDYVNRHGDHSLNAMFVCGPKLRFYYVSSRWPGSVHDARVFRNSSLKRRLDRGWRPIQFGVLLGDSAYPDTNYLVTPVANVRTEQDRRFNIAHRKTRNLVECSIGVLKQRFRCLLDVMYFHPLFACEVIRCCAALHNLLMEPDDAARFLIDFERDGGANGNDGNQVDQGRIGDVTRKRELIALF